MVISYVRDVVLISVAVFRERFIQRHPDSLTKSEIFKYCKQIITLHICKACFVCNAVST